MSEVKEAEVKEEPTKKRTKKCDLFIGGLSIDSVTGLLDELSLLSTESWWDKNVEGRMEEFKTWIGDHDYPSKIIGRKYIISQEYKSILDCGCGLCTEYHGYKKDEYQIKYTGLDFCEKLVEMALKDGIDVKHGKLEEIPMPDNSVEVSFARHVLEHMFDYEKAISEMIRVAQKEVVVIFFIPPVDSVPPESDFLKFDSEEKIWHNKYQKFQMDKFILSNPKVASISWDVLPDIKESILKIKLKEETPSDQKEETLLEQKKITPIGQGENV